MKLSLIILLSLVTIMSGCAEKRQAATVDENYEVFARKVYDALKQRDTDAFIELCANAYDEKLDGTPLLYETDRREGSEWTETHRIAFNYFIDEIERTGGMDSLEWVQLGKVLGSLPSESGFIGNIYIEVNIGYTVYYIEIGVTQLSKDRGRVITASTPLILQTESHYEKNANEPQMPF